MRILAAEDNPVFQSMLRTLLRKWGYQAILAHDGNEAWHILEAGDAPRLAVLDWMMPGMDGVEICRRVRSIHREPYTYILLLTARTESQDLVEGMDAGADDYLTKPFNAQELRVRIRAGRRILDLQDALRLQATHDGLTRLLNRNSILEKLDEEIARNQRESSPVALLMVDLDHFKSINDTHGHLAGDAVLREAASRMKTALRCYDSLGRYGGEEFLVVLPGCDLANAAVQGERLRLAVAAQSFPLPHRQLAVTCSIGVASTAVHPPETLIRRADEALYQAKSQGRNRVVSSE
ncbi:MAG TPA: diguanylate cyclase [Candidatus Acidoferrales bacterium]|nr:diguanylate cyclase [Candidatus Acidoferrales bacterium]